jgi:hypothetical protein
MFNKSLEARLAESEQNLTKTTGYLTAVCAFLVSAFTLNKEQGEAVATGDTKPLESGLAALSQPFKNLCAQLVAAFKVSAEDAPKFFVSAGDDKPSPLMAAITNLQTDSVSLGSLRGVLATALGIKAEEVAALDNEKLTAAIEKIANKKAVAIAAAQGVPALPTDPAAATSEDDEVRLAFENAAQEKDPLKRGQLYAAASKLVMQKKSKANN